MPKEKVVNYSPEMVIQMTDIYQAATNETERESAVLEIQELTGKTVASIRSKLAHENVWIAKAKKAASEKKSTKSELVAQIADFAEMKNDSFFESIAGSNRSVLEYVLQLQVDLQSAEFELSDLESSDSENESEVSG